MINPELAEQLIGLPVTSFDGARLGILRSVYADETTEALTFASVQTGDGSELSTVPLELAEFIDDEVRVPYDEPLLRSAPAVDSSRLSSDIARALNEHYSLPTAHGPEADIATDEVNRGWDDGDRA